jgi:hypothetical protein
MEGQVRAVAASLNGFCSALATRRQAERVETAALRAQLQQAEQEARELRRERNLVRECHASCREVMGLNPWLCRRGLAAASCRACSVASAESLLLVGLLKARKNPP